MKSAPALGYYLFNRLFNDELFQLIIELICILLAFVGQLDRLTEIEAEDTENRLAVHLVLARFEVYVALKSNEDVDQLINVVDFFKLNVKSHFQSSFQKYLLVEPYILII